MLISVHVQMPFLWLLKAQEMQSALKKQEKVWKTRMQKLGASYLDQLKDVGCKF